MAVTRLWETPSPSSGFLDGVSLRANPGRTCVLTFRHEGKDGGWETCEVHFHGVAAFKCTYLPALTAELIESAYDTLVDLGRTSWLDEAGAVRTRRGDGAPLKHLRICFDDGPCYEFLCAGFEVSRGT